MTLARNGCAKGLLQELVPVTSPVFQKRAELSCETALGFLQVQLASPGGFSSYPLLPLGLELFIKLLKIQKSHQLSKLLSNQTLLPASTLFHDLCHSNDKLGGAACDNLGLLRVPLPLLVTSSME